MLSATPVETGQKKRPAFYRECDDGRVMPSELPPPRQNRRMRGTPTQDYVGEKRSSEVVCDHNDGNVRKKVRGRGFTAYLGETSRMRADEQEVEHARDLELQAATRLREQEEVADLAQDHDAGYTSDHSVASEAGSERSVGSVGSVSRNTGSANSKLLAKYKLILKKLQEKRRAQSLEPDRASGSDDEPPD